MDKKDIEEACYNAMRRKEREDRKNDEWTWRILIVVLIAGLTALTFSWMENRDNDNRRIYKYVNTENTLL